MAETAKMYYPIVNGKKVRLGEVRERFNPGDNRELVARHRHGSHEVLHEAVESARKAFPAWARVPQAERGRLVLKAAQLHGTPKWHTRFKDAMRLEVGKTAVGANGESVKATKILEFMGGLGRTDHLGDIPADQPGVHMYMRRRPAGVVAIVTPFNFPDAVPCWELGAALVAGNSVVFKPSPVAPMTSQLLMELFEEAGLPVGVMNLVHGDKDIVRALVENPKVDAVGFTGSTEGGTNVRNWALNRPVKPMDPRFVSCEMGGQNPLIVMEDADLEAAANALVDGGLKDGQRCTATSRAIVHKDVLDDFMSKVLERAIDLKIGPGKDPSNQVGPLISKEAITNVLSEVGKSIHNGMQLLWGGERLVDGDLKHGNFMVPTLLMGDPYNEGHLALRKEIFAPVVGVCAVSSLDEAIRVAKETVEHRHAASIFTRNPAYMHQFEEHIDHGMVHINNPTFGGDAQAAFGGMGGATSIGLRKMGPRALDAYTKDQTIDDNRAGVTLAAGAR